MGGVGATTVTAGAAHAATCPSASQITVGATAVTSQVAGLGALLGGLSGTSGLTAVQSAAPATVTTLTATVAGLSSVTGGLGGLGGGCSPLNAVDSQTVAAAFATLTQTATTTLASLTKDHDVFAQFGQTLPIAATLATLEAALDGYGLALSSVTDPTQGAAILGSTSRLDGALGPVLSLYRQVCIPSPLYPILKPICFGA